jgi:radical SAM protein with 4Fe4S-binding SPASM domain
MDEYFLLGPECYLVEGAKRGAIYNLLSGDLISLDENALAIVKSANKGTAIEELHKTFKLDEVKAVIFSLIQLQSGNYYKEFHYIEKLRDGMLISDKSGVIVNHLFIEVTRECNLDCVFCNKESIKANRRTGCKRWPGKVYTKLSDYIGVIQDAWHLGCRKIQFIGGEPFCEWENGFKYLLEDVDKVGFSEVIINTNATYLNEEIISYCVKNEIHLIVQVYSYSEKCHNRIAGVDGIFEKQIRNMEKLLVKGVKFTILLMITKENQTEFNSSKNFFESFSKNIIVDSVFPINEKTDIYSPDVAIRSLNQTKETLPRINTQLFFNRIKGYHPCLNGKLAVTLDGLVYPCIMLREEPLADIRNGEELCELFSRKRHEKYWYFDSNKIPKCESCEYKYACFDCRAIEISSTNDLFGKKFCSYNPKHGE